MIRRFRPPQFFARVAACLALALFARAGLRADDPPQVPEKTAPPAPPASPEVASAQPAALSAKPAAAPKRAGDEIHGLLNLGTSLADRGEFEGSEIAFRQVLNAPEVGLLELKTGLLGLARMHRKQGAFTKAAAIYERYLQDYPGDERSPNALLELGRTLRDMGVYKLAIGRFYSVITSTTKLPEDSLERYQALAKTAKFEIAETHFQSGNFVEASKFYLRLRLEDLAPADRARAHFKEAYALRLQGELEPAVATLRSYIAQWPEDDNIPEARYLLSITLRELKRPQEAFAATLDLLRTEKSRIAADPKRWAYWQRRTGNQLANDFFDSGDTLNAQAIYSSLLELSPEPAWQLPITYQLALCYDRLGITDRARLSYQTIVDAAASNPSPDLVELARMAAWRIEHIEWRDRVAQQIAKMFESTTGKQAATPLPLASKTAAIP